MAISTIRQYTMDELKKFREILGSVEYSSTGSTFQLALVKRIQKVLTTDGLLANDEFKIDRADRQITKQVLARFPSQWEFVSDDLREDGEFLISVIQEQIRQEKAPNVNGISDTLDKFGEEFYRNTYKFSKYLLPAILNAQKANNNFRLTVSHNGQLFNALLYGDLPKDILDLSALQYENSDFWIKLVAIEPGYGFQFPKDGLYYEPYASVENQQKRILSQGITEYCAGYTTIPSGDNILIERSPYIRELAKNLGIQNK